MTWKYNPFSQTVDNIGPSISEAANKIITAELTINTINNDNYHTDEVQMIVVDNDGNVITE